MSRENPEKAIAALIPSPLEAVPGVVVRPMTLGMWAALERIKSPLVTGDEPKDTLELVPSLYLITHDPREIFRPDFLDAAMKWADTMPVDVVAAIDKAARRQIDAAVDVIPEDDGKSSKKKRRMDHDPRRLGGGDLRMELRADPLGNPALRDLPPEEAGRREGGEGIPAPGNRGD